MKNTKIAAKLLEMAKELVELAVVEQEAPEKEQETSAGLQLGKVYQRFGVPYNSTVMATSPSFLRDSQHFCGFRKDSDGEVDDHGFTFGAVDEWQEVTDEWELKQFAHDAFTVMDVKEGDYLTVFWDGFDTNEAATARRRDPSVIKVTGVGLNGFWPCVDGNSVSVVSKAVPPEDNSYLFPAVFRKSTAEEIAMYEEHFHAEPPVIVSASGLQLKEGDCVYADWDNEYAKVGAIDPVQERYCIKYFSKLDRVVTQWITVGAHWDRSLRMAEPLEEALIESVFALHESETVK